MVNKSLLGCFLLLLGVQAFAQTGTIKGVVRNSRTNERLPFATVFINYTTLGTSADERGEFTLKNIPLGQHELVVTFVGHHFYQSKIVVKDTTAMTTTVRLEANELREVKVHSKRDKNWQRQYEKFKKLFLGNTIHGVRCEILNPWVLDFETDNIGFFKARASDILQIKNYSLGYTLFYQVKKFSISSHEFTISGNVRFKPMETSDTATLHQWIKNRQDVYEGSSRHLFKSIVDKTVTEEGFELYRDNTGSADIIRMAGFLRNLGKEITPYGITSLPYDRSVPGEFKIRFPQRLEVHYLNKSDEPRIYGNVTHPISWMEVENDFLIINSQGIVLNPYNLLQLGIMSEARMAEFLPYDFQPLETEKFTSSSILKKKTPVNSLSYLLEKPYLHTDKSYYYPNETIWFRGYIKYSAPVFKDSLSQVLYVDLIDTSKNVIASKILPIASGNAIGSLDVPSTVVGGDYTLRAYTRWILNFDSTLVFVKPLKVLEYTEVGKAMSAYISNDSTNAVTIDVEKDSFKTRELISIKLGIKDFLENFSPANFSISVTDLKQVVPAENENTILNEYDIPPIQLPDSLPKKVEFPIQQGIDFRGRFVTKKEKPAQGIVTVLQENTSEVFMITTEENGNFSFNNLRLYDSSKLALMAKTIKGKRGKVLIDSAEQYSPATRPVEPLKIEVYEAENPSKYNSSSEFLNARMLDEVVIHGAKETEKSSSFGGADATVTGDYLRATNSNNVLLSLQSMVPGLRVVNGTILLGPPASFGVQRASDAEPLFLVDGVPVNSAESIESMASRISAMNPNEIERIEVYKYSSGAIYGARGATGVISITTRKGTGDHPSNYEMAKFDQIKMKGLSSSKKFYSPDYSNPGNQARADYRATIYWNPFVRTNENNQAQISFYAADLATQYRIVVEGITNDGRIVHGEKLITIEERP